MLKVFMFLYTNKKQNITWELITGSGLMSKGILHLSLDCSVLNVSPAGAPAVVGGFVMPPT